jgi:hypothetical protein
MFDVSPADTLQKPLKKRDSSRTSQNKGFLRIIKLIGRIAGLLRGKWQLSCHPGAYPPKTLEIIARISGNYNKGIWGISETAPSRHPKCSQCEYPGGYPPASLPPIYKLIIKLPPLRP